MRLVGWEISTTWHCFNPRTHVGCDSRSSGFRYENLRFNPRTHVGCDLRTCPAPSRRCWFQSTHPRRVRHQCIYNIDNIALFQSTHPRRVRHFVFSILRNLRSFNPRTHVGCDIININTKIYKTMFQSTHPRRVRRMAGGVAMVEFKFQSTHPRRVRLPMRLLIYALW